ncbi:MAG TPA: trypsin-like peptidase domain-containing protein, partial [Allocoleopsis sp.]
MPEKLLKLAINTLLVITLGNSHLSAAIPPKITTAQTPIINAPKKAENPLEIARQITVRIITNAGGGSGVLIGKHGNTYTILTNNHVVSSIGNGKYTVLTADGISHQGQLIKSPQVKDLDLAMIQFNSYDNYRIAEIAKSDDLILG